MVRSGVAGGVHLTTPKNSVSAVSPDWERERPQGLWDPPRRLLASIRRYQHWRAEAGLVARAIKSFAVVEHHFWSVVTGSDIPLNCQIAGGLVLTHPNGVVIHPEASVGPNCLILQQVTLTAGVKLGGHVDVGAGAKIIGEVQIGDHAKIGANAVVLTNVPAGATAVGIPARIVGQRPADDGASPGRR